MRKLAIIGIAGLILVAVAGCQKQDQTVSESDYTPVEQEFVSDSGPVSGNDSSVQQVPVADDADVIASPVAPVETSELTSYSSADDVVKDVDALIGDLDNLGDL